MKRFVPMVPVLLALVSCGGDEGGKPRCSASKPCAKGSYCAQTPDGDVCWPDAVAPVIASGSVTCSTTPCRRDAVLHVTAEVADDESMGAVVATLGIDEAHPRAMSRVSGNAYAVDVPLAEVAFPWFAHDVEVAVSATDEAQNAATPWRHTVTGVTRARWTRQLKGATALSLSSPALLPDGRVVVAGSDGKLYFVAKDGASSSSVQVASDVPSGAPSVGAGAIWLGTLGGKLHEVRFNGAVESLPANCSTSQGLVGPPAVAGEHAFIGSRSEVVITADTAGFCTPANAAGVVTSPVSVNQAGRVMVVTGFVLRSMSLPESGVLKDDWTGIAPAPAAPTLADIVTTSIVVDGSGGMWTAAQNGGVNRTTASASTSVISTLSSLSAGAIVLADGSVVLGDTTKRMVRVTASGSVPWSRSDLLVGTPGVGLALNGPDPAILVPTDQGRLYAISQADGREQWSVELSGQALQPANIWTEPGATTSTAYVAGADGNLYAVVVDGALDTSAPWPKAFHDPQNTSNAGTTP